MADDTRPAHGGRRTNPRVWLISGAIGLLFLASIASCLLALLLGDPLPTYQDPPPALAQRAAVEGRLFEWLMGISALLLLGAIVACLILVAIVVRGQRRRPG